MEIINLQEKLQLNATNNPLFEQFDSTLVELELKKGIPFRIYNNSFNEVILNFDSAEEEDRLYPLFHLEGEVMETIVNIYFGVYASGQTFVITAIAGYTPHLTNKNVKLIEVLEAAKHTWIVLNSYAEHETSDEANYSVLDWQYLDEPMFEHHDPMGCLEKLFKRKKL
jgi:hypothetical protein